MFDSKKCFLGWIAACTIPCIAGVATAAPLALTPIDDWVLTPGGVQNPDVVITDANTNTPTIEETPADDDNAIGGTLFGGQWGSTVSLAIGEKVIVTGDVTWYGTQNGGAAVRIGLLSGTTGEAAGNTGYKWDDDDLGGSDGLFTSRTSSSWSSTGGDTVGLGNVGTNTGTWENGISYDFLFSVERTGADSAEVIFSMTDNGTGSDPIDILITGTDNNVTSGPGSFDFNWFSWNFGGTFPASKNKEADSAVFSPVNIEVVSVPEPASMGLLAAGAALISLRRRSH